MKDRRHVNISFIIKNLNIFKCIFIPKCLIQAMLLDSYHNEQSNDNKNKFKIIYATYSLVGIILIVF